jgi:hypothetical protein
VDKDTETLEITKHVVRDREGYREEITDREGYREEITDREGYRDEIAKECDDNENSMDASDDSNEKKYPDYCRTLKITGEKENNRFDMKMSGEQ